MRLKTILKINLATAIFSCLLFCNLAGATSPYLNAAQGIEISPALVELNAERGSSYQINLSIRNITAADLIYSSSVADFTSADETGSPKISIDEDLPNSASIRTWTNLEPDFLLKPNQSKEVIAKINIPIIAEPGGHYGVIRFTNSVPGTNASGVGLSGSAGVLILIRVSGDIKEEASLSEFFTAINEKQTNFFENSPVTFVARIKNEGNIHIKPTGSILIYDIFGNLVSTLPMNSEKSNVLPSSIRRFDTKSSNNFMIGRFRADLALGYGLTGQAITRTIFFWVIPYKLIFICLLTMATLIFVFIRLVSVYNRYIINKSKNEKTIKNKKHFNTKK